jgi:DNA modification methylase
MLKTVHAHPYSRLNLSNSETNRDVPRHRWFQFKEGFSADLVKLAVADLGRRKTTRLLDPFAGSGTTPVQAGFMRLPVTAIEVNPFLHFAITAKCLQTLDGEASMRSVVSQVLRSGQTADRSPLEGRSTFAADDSQNVKGLFNVEVLRAFSGLQESIRRRKTIRRPLELALLSALLDCSNAKRDGKCLRYKRRPADWSGPGAPDLRRRFEGRALQAISDLARGEFDSSGITIISGDSRAVLKDTESSSHDLLVTSPPYLNSFDYSDVYRPELFAGGFVDSNDALRAIRLRTLCSHVQVKREFSSEVVTPLLEPTLARLNAQVLWNKNIPAMVRTYFADLQVVLKDAHRIVRRNGKAWIVVSTSAYGGVEIPVDLILADVAVREGWRLTGVFVLRQLRAAGQQWPVLGSGARPPLRESLIILEK